MYIFFHDVEELHNSSRNGYNGSIASAFHDTKALFVDIIYRNRSITYAFERAILKSPLESIEKKHLESH